MQAEAWGRVEGRHQPDHSSAHAKAKKGKNMVFGGKCTELRMEV